MDLTTIILVRHGETYHNVSQDHYVDGHGRPIPVDCRTPASDRNIYDLNPRGRQQAEHLAQALARYPIDLCFRSPAQRVADTLAPYLDWRHAQDGNPVPCQIRPGLDEHNAGDRSAWGTDSDPWAAWQKAGNSILDFVWPGGESLTALFARVTPVINEIFTVGKGKTVLVGGHSDMNKALINWLAGTANNEQWRYDHHQNNACINVLRCRDGRLTPHADGESLIGMQNHMPAELQTMACSTSLTS